MIAITGNAWIDFLITLGIVCIVVGAVIKLAAYFQVPIPQPVYIIGGAIIGILLLLWLGRLLMTLAPG